MFGGGNSTEYEEIVNKTTDENLTSENWEMIMNLCDKVQEEGQTGAHSVITAILKRLAHRNPNVQLYALSLTEALSKNLGIEIHREIASRAFTQGLERVIADRNTHEKVRRRALGLIALWAAEFENNTDLGLMEDCYNNLKAKNYKFELPEDPVPPTVDDEARRREEEELQRVLEMSMQDRGGRGQWAQYSLAGASAGSSSAGAAASSSSSKPPASAGAAGGSSSAHPFAQPKYSGGYVPARTPSPVSSQSAAAAAAQQRAQAAQYHQAQAAYAQQQQQAVHQPQQAYPSRSSSLGEATPTPGASIPTAATSNVPATSSPASSSFSTATATGIPSSSTPVPGSTSTSTLTQTQAVNMNIVTRVRALHTFEPTEPGELAFNKGDIIKVVDRGYKDWWRGQLKGRTGIFPVNYVEPLPEPTAAELAREAESEAAVFAQAVNVEKLLNMLRELDPNKDNLADNEEIQELYRGCMALRPKIVKLIDKYSQKRADLVSMNETFVRARTIFDRMMEESLARHTGVYDQGYRPQGPQYRPESAAGGPGGRPGPQGYGWSAASAAMYEGYSAPVPAGPVGYGVPIPQVVPGPGPAPGPGAAPQDVHGQVPYGPAAPSTPGQGQPGYVNGAVGPQPQQGLPYGVAGGPYAGGVYAQAAPQHQVQPQVQAPQGPQPQQGPHQQVPVYGAGPQQQPQVQQQQGPYQQSVHSQAPAQAPTQPQVYQQQQQQPAQGYPQQQQQQSASSPLAGGTSPQQAHLQPQPVFEYQQQQQPQQHQALPATSQPQPTGQPAAAAQPQIQHAQPASQTHPVSQAQPQSQQAPQPQPASQSQAQAAPQQPISGPGPYPYDPSYTYADPNVQAWAQYYAAGGKEMAGAVYFLSIPGLTDGGAAGGAQQGQQGGQGQGQQQQAEGHGQSQSQQGEQPYGAALNADAAASNASLSSTAVTAQAAAPIQEQQQQRPGMGQYQLSDPGPVQQVPVQGQPQPAAQAPAQYANYQPSTSLTDLSTTGLKQSSPTSTLVPGPGAGGSGHSPTSSISGSTPAWVLPKKSGPATPGGPVAGLASQFGGVSLSDQ